MGSRTPNAKGQIWRLKGWPILKYMDSAMSCAKPAEPIEMPFGMWTLVGLEKHAGTTWRTRLNRPCVAAMRSFFKLLWPLVSSIIIIIISIVKFASSLAPLENKTKQMCWSPKHAADMYVTHRHNFHTAVRQIRTRLQRKHARTINQL